MNSIADFPKLSRPRAVTRGPRDHFLANYFGIDAWSPDYGYAGEGQDPRKGVVFPEDDGLWRVDLTAGERRTSTGSLAVLLTAILPPPPLGAPPSRKGATSQPARWS